MAKKNQRNGPGVGALTALAAGFALILIPEPTTTGLGLAVVAATLGVQAVS